MNFFEAQDKARRNTFWLVLLFSAAVIGLILLTNLFLMSVYAYYETQQIIVSPVALYQYHSWESFALVAVGVVLLILGGSLYKTLSLSGGGTTIAEMLGGQLVSHATRDPLRRRLLNVVEEMAIAAGMPIPQVYIMSDRSINAFAAGRTPADAVIGVTEGTLARLSREELQGVIAHEFSHIANGDMRLNIRLIALLHGILLIGLIGYFMVRSIRFSGRSRGKGGSGIAGIAAIGLGLMIIGYAGTFFGQWIKAIVSRQREYLADSSAVQFTRNIDGISGALKKIGGSGVGSYLSSPSAPEYSHAYFANGISGFFQSMFATHPPLEDRIKRIEPYWDGDYLESQFQAVLEPEPAEPAESPGGIVGAAVAATVLSSAEQAINEVGTLNEKNIEYVRELIIAMPLVLREAAQDAYSARAVIYAGLVQLQKDPDAALKSIATTVADPDMLALVKKLTAEFGGLDNRAKLPLLELCIHSLREMSLNQYELFKTTVQNIIVSDRSIKLREWWWQRFVMHHLDSHFGLRKAPRGKYSSLDNLREEVELVLSLVAHVDCDDAEEARAAFAAGTAETGLQELEMQSLQELSLERLEEAFEKLAQTKPLVKPALLKACVALIMHDGQASSRGIELVRTISISLDCPMPPMRGPQD